MDEDKIERQMEFIVEQQAQFAAKIGQLEDNLTRLTGTVERQGETVERLSAVVEQQGENIERLTGVVGQVADAVGRLAQLTLERFDETDRKIAALVDAQIRTEETVSRMGEDISRMGGKIDNLTAVVERHIVEGHGGRAEAES